MSFQDPMTSRPAAPAATCRSSGVRTAEGVEDSETESAAALPNLGLQKDPANRLQSARELACRLEALPLEKWTPERAEDWWRGVTPSSPDISDADTWALRPAGSRIIAPAD